MPTDVVTHPDAPANAPTLDEPLLCPLCGYDLRATTKERCPECGYRFTWAELRDPALRLHPYAFEHHPERNLTSFLQTLLAGLRPGRFWRTLFPTQPSRPGRLVLYWMVAGVIPCVLPLALFVLRAAPAAETELRNYRALLLGGTMYWAEGQREQIVAQHGSYQAFVDVAAPEPTAWTVVPYLVTNYVTARTLTLLGALWLLWPWATFAVLMIFQASMRRARVRSIHVLRCVLYTADTALWAGAATVAFCAWDVWQQGLVSTGGFRGGLYHQAALLVTIVAFILCTWRLAAAYRHYLRFDHAFATALASQIILLLAAACIAVNWSVIQFF